MATRTLTEATPKVIMATSLLNLTVRNNPQECIPRGHVLTTVEDINHYPECNYSELVNLANHFGWLIFPLSLWDWKATINALAKEDLVYAWDVYQAQLRFQKIVGDDNDFYMMAPKSFMDKYELAKNFNTTFDKIYFPPQEDAYMELLNRLRTTLCRVGERLKTNQQVIQKDVIDQIHDKWKERWAKDPIIFSIGKSSSDNNDRKCRIGCCFGEPIPDYLVNSLPKYDNGIEETIVFPFILENCKKVNTSVNDLIEKYTLLYYAYWRVSLSYYDSLRVTDKINKLYPDFSHDYYTVKKRYERKRSMEQRDRLRHARAKRCLSWNDKWYRDAVRNLLRNKIVKVFESCFSTFMELWDNEEFYECLKYVAVFNEMLKIFERGFPAASGPFVKFRERNPEFWNFYNVVRAVDTI